MKGRLGAEKAAKQLAEYLDLPSWGGCVFVWLKNDQFVLKVAINSRQIDRLSAPIPKTYKGFEVEIDDQITGEAFHHFRLNKCLTI